MAGKHKHHRHRRSTRIKHRIIFIFVALLLLFAACGFFTGYSFYNSALSVKSEASQMMDEVSDLKDQLFSDDPNQARATALDIAEHAQHMKATAAGWEWTVASFIPVYGSDVAKVRELTNIVDDFADNGIVPLSESFSSLSVKHLIQDKNIDIAEAQKAVDAFSEIAPAVDDAVNRLDALGSAQLEQVNDPLGKARDKIGELNSIIQCSARIAPSFSDMVGANGNHRTYVIVAQNNAEIRPTGGFLGSVGAVTVDNGHIELGQFRSVYDIYPDKENGAPITSEEEEIFGRHVSYQVADCNFIPDFSRVGEIVGYAWETKGYGPVDGVIGVDPIFLQHMLALVGPITTANGTVVDGGNAARVLLHDTYYIEDSKEQDAFFEEVASLSFERFMDKMGEIPVGKLMNTLTKDISDRRLQIWMRNQEEEQAMGEIGADGALSHDIKNPQLGIYFADESYSKLFWYLKTDTTVGSVIEHPDGSLTYPVTLTYRNMINNDSNIPPYVQAHNPLARSKDEMLCWVMMSAPEGGKISGCKLLSGEFVPEGSEWREDGSKATGSMTQATFQGLDFWYGFTRTSAGKDFSMSFYVTCPPSAEKPLKVVCTPNAQEEAGW